MKNNEIYQKVTNTILDSLAKGVVPWHRPWSSAHQIRHTNLQSKKAYRGINQFLCEISAMEGGFSSPYWLSKKQIIARGGSWSGSGTMITFWKRLRIKTDEIDSKGKPVYKIIPLLKFYYVWNTDQCTGIKVPEPKEVPEFNPIEEAQSVIDKMPDAPTIFHRGDRAFYSPLADIVTLPAPEAFESPEAYYSTGFHELTHSTGHESRLGREFGSRFGDDDYANEELVAELGAAMLCATVGITTTHEASASYIENWSSRFKADPKLIVKAAGQGQKAADCILGITFDPEPAPAEKEVEHV